MGGVSAEAIGSNMPSVVSLDDLAAMNDADQRGHRYETSPEGVLTVTPLPDSGHAEIASRLVGWLLAAGWAPEQVLQAVGIRIPGPERDGGRIPDLTVWRKPPAPNAWPPVDDLLLAVEILTPASRPTDEMVKLAEYAAAGIPQYWVVDRGETQTTSLYRLDHRGGYAKRAKIPLAWLLNTDAAEDLVAWSP